MFELCFGIFWCLITLLCTIPIFKSSEGIDLFIILFIGIFWVVGIFLLVKGLKKVITNHNTETLGEECYAMISNIYPNGNRVNGAPEFNADFLVYVSSKNTIEQVSESIGFKAFKYQLNTFIKGKHYNGDINIKETIDYNSIPLNIRPNFDHLISNNTNQIAEDIITINGVKYKKIDE